ncbi:MAG: hypothetical protein FWG56_02065 [Desulfovibrionaceae bacterium]|jgi:hypothetical protein|nr:hypothetical protein [Desulfovibrionaceae bacterium]
MFYIISTTEGVDAMDHLRTARRRLQASWMQHSARLNTDVPASKATGFLLNNAGFCNHTKLA